MNELHFDTEALIAEALELARIPAPPFGEGPRVDEVERRLRAIPRWRVERDATGNVVARLGPDAPGALWLLTHLDTVFPAGTLVDFTRAGGVLRGPGIGDNAVALAATLALARRLPAWHLARPVVLAFTVGEEGLSNLRGANALLAHGGAASASAVLAVEGHRGDEIGGIAVGSVRYRAAVRGLGGHSWWDRGTPSALHTLIDFCHAVVEGARAIPGDPAVNVGTLTGGAGVTAIATEAAAVFEGRSPSAEALAAFEGLVEMCRARGPLDVTVELLGRRPAGVLAADHPLIEATRVARRRAGLAEGRLGSSSSDANPFIAAGIPALCIGVTTGRYAHQLGEEIDIAPIAGGAAMLAHLALALSHDTRW